MSSRLCDLDRSVPTVRVVETPASIARPLGGVTISDDESFDLSTLLDAADRALYRAKARGGNRVELSTHSATERPIKRRADLFSAA